jgi:hypothetical protein
MRFDIFFSICQTEVDGYTPDERTMWKNFFAQAELADALGFGTAWIAETHLSCQIQKQNPGAVIPHFKGEIGLNTDVLQVAHILFARTKKMHIGSAIRNIQCNGGPIAHAELIKTFLSLQSLMPYADRILDIGFASGRFPFSNTPYGIKPRSQGEVAAWPVMKLKIFQEATEIFLRLLRGEILSSKEISPTLLQAKDFRNPTDWQKAQAAFATQADTIPVPSRWDFDKIGVIPFEAPLEQLRLTIGSHDSATQVFANTFLPCGVFNLSITPDHQIEETHQRMTKAFHPSGGAWTRHHMPRTVLVFIDQDAAKAKTAAQKALENYWSVRLCK